MPRALLDKYLEDEVTGTDLWLSPVVPDGQTWHVGKFGGGAVAAALVALQVRTATGPDVWQTIRAVFGPGHGELDVNRDYVGDAGGVLRFRVVRQEKSGTPQPIVCWLEGYKVT
jgi:hypothetical protein